MAVKSDRAAPSWVFPLYLAGLAVIYLGERVLSGLPRGAGAFSALGVLMVLAATAIRFSPRFQVGGERRSIERLLAILSVVGLIGVGCYFVTTDWGAAKFGLDKMASEKRQSVLELLLVIWVALITFSTVPQLFAETALRPMRNAERPESRRVRAAATAGMTLALAAVYGGLFVYAAGGTGFKADYSYFKTSRPGEATIKMAKTLSDPIRVVAFFPDVNEVKSEVESYLRDLAKESPKLKVEIKDRLLSPKLAKELRATQDGVVILAKGTLTQTLTIGTELEAARPKLKTLDRDFQEQLLKLARSRRTAYLTVGHGELNDTPKGTAEKDGRTASIVKLLLQKQNIVVKDLGLGQGLANEIPSDADAVFILGPSEPFAPEEIATLRRYGERGGHLLIALDPESISTQNLVTPGEAPVPPAPVEEPKPTQPAKADVKAGATKPASSAKPPAPTSSPAPPQLAALAELAGLTFSPDILANEKQHLRVRDNDSDRTRLVATSFSSHAAVSTLSRNSARGAAIVVFGAGSLDKLSASPAKVDFAVRSVSGTFGDKNRDYKLDKDSEKSASFNLVAAVTKPIAGAPAPPPEPKKDDKAKDKNKKEDRADTKEFRAFVTADVDAFSDLVMSNVVGNQALLVDACRWLLGEEKWAGTTNSEEDVKIEHTKQQDLAWFYATIIGVPCLVLGAGVFFGRRSLRARGGKS